MKTLERCGFPECDHSLASHSEDGLCVECPDAIALHYFVMPVATAGMCSCCGETRPSVQQRPTPQIPGPGPLLCDDCFADPALTYADCHHGYDEASPVGKARL